MIIVCFDELDVFLYPPGKEQVHEHYQVYDIYLDYCKSKDKDKFCQMHFLPIESMSNIELMVKKITKVLSSVFSECALHPFHNVHQEEKVLIKAFVYASHSDQLIEKVQGKARWINESGTDVEVDHHIARHLMNGHFVFTSAVVVDGKLKFSFYTELSPLQMLFFKRNQSDEIYRKICLKLKIQDQYFTRLNSI